MAWMELAASLGMSIAEYPPLLLWPPFITEEPPAVPEVLAGLAESQYWPGESLERGQQVQLLSLLQWAEKEVSYYREAGWSPEAIAELRRRPEDFWDIWRGLPILTKAELRSQGARLNARNVPHTHQPLKKVVTSGSTGIPVEIGSTAITRLVWSALSLREIAWRGRNFGKRLGAIRYLAKPDREPLGTLAPAWPKLVSDHHRTGPFGIIHVGFPVSELAEWLRAFNPHYLITHPSVAAALMDELDAKPPALEEILFVAEPLPPELEARLKDEWGVRSAEYYSANEIGYIAFRCAEQDSLHIQSEASLVEILDEDGRPCRPGEPGRVVVTSLHNFATPLIRYELGDYATVGEPCACGRALPVIEKVLGRVRNLAQTPDRRRYWPVALGKLRSMSSVRQFQYVQTAPDTIQLRLVLNQALTEEENNQAVEFARAALGYPFRIEVVPVSEIARGPTGKYEEFFSLIPAG
jgi:phenylacetate-CoA ligase